MNYLLFAAPIVVLVAYWLVREGWSAKNAASLALSLLWGLFFGLDGSVIITQVFPGVYADSLWLITFLGLWAGSGFFASVPFLKEGEYSKATRVFELWIAAGFAYTALDNMFFGPYAVGPGSYLLGQNLTTQPPSYLAEDLAFGSFLQRLGLDPFTGFAAFLCYIVYS